MLAENLRYQLDQRRWSIVTLARESGIPREIISAILRGKTLSPRLDTMMKLASALQITIDDLAFGNGNRSA